jgi:hypothetical protein
MDSKDISIIAELVKSRKKLELLLGQIDDRLEELE